MHPFNSSSDEQEPPSFVAQVYGGDSRDSLEPCGTAFFVNEQQLLTCRHVICKDYKISGDRMIYGSEYETIAIDFKGKRFYCDMEYTARHLEHDIAVICIQKAVEITIPQMSALDSQTASCLKKADAWGFPLALNATLSSFKITHYLKHRKWSQKTGIPWRIQFDGGVAQGYSGGPILFKDANSWHCLGLTDLGRAGAATSNSLTSNELQEFLTIRSIPFQKGILPNLTARKARNIAAVGLFCSLASIGVWQNTTSVRNSSSVQSARATIPVKSQHNAIPLGRCNVTEMDNFRNDKQYHLLVLRYANVGDVTSPSASVGYNIGRTNEQHIKKLITEHAKLPNWNLASLNDANVQVLFQGCFVENHEQANDIGLQKKADIVVWGRVLDGDIANPSILGITHPNITIVRFPSLTLAISQKNDYGTAQEFLRLRFDELVPDDALNLILGLYAYRNDRYGIVLDYLGNFENRNWPVTEDSSDLLSVITRSYIFTGNSSAAVKVAQRAKVLCPNEHCTAHRFADLAMAAHYDKNKPMSDEASQQAIIIAQKINDETVMQIANYFKSIDKNDDVLRTIRNKSDNQRVSTCAAIEQAERDIAKNDNYEDIEKELKISIENALSCSDMPAEARAQIALGGLYFKYDKFNDAELAFERANLLLVWTGYYSLQAEVLIKLSLTYLQNQKEEKYHHYTHLAEQLMRNHKETETKTYCAVAARLAMLDKTRAHGLSFEDRALKCMEATKFYDWKPAVLLSKAVTLTIQKQSRQAKRLVSEAVKLCNNKNPPEYCKMQKEMIAAIPGFHADSH